MDEHFLFTPTKVSAIRRIEFSARLLPNVIYLAQGTPSTASDPRIRAAAIDAIEKGLTDGYSHSPGLPALREKIATQLRTHNVAYNPSSEIIITAGATEAISATLLALLEQGDEVIVPTPAYFAHYAGAVHMAKGKLIAVPLTASNDWQLDSQEIIKRCTNKTRVIILCNPNNPTGSIQSKQTLLAIAQFAQEHNIVLLLDDVYDALYFDEAPFPLWQQPQFRESIVRIVSFSKDFALCGWRVGFLHGPEALVQNILAVHDRLINCAPVPSQHAALAALDIGADIHKQNMGVYKTRRTLMTESLEQLKPFLSYTKPAGAYYYFPKILGVTNSEKLAFDILNKVQVAVVPGSDFGPGGEGHIRLCFGRSVEDITEGMQRLTYYLNYHINR